MESYGFNKESRLWKALRIHVQLTFDNEHQDTFYAVIDTKSSISQCNKNILDTLQSCEELEKQGKTALDLARVNGTEEIENFLTRTEKPKVRFRSMAIDEMALEAKRGSTA